MLKRVDRIQLAVKDREAAESVVAGVFGAELIKHDEVKALAARRSTMQAGTGLFELLEPAGSGPVADFVSKWRSGLFAAGFSVEDLEQAEHHMAGAGAEIAREGGQIFVDPSSTRGMRAVISAHHERAPVRAAIRWVYEVTNVTSDWRAAGDLYARLFGLDTAKYRPITSAEFGYTGTLTMFDTPGRLDRIELTQITAPGAMGRFHQRRGDSLYMFYVETDDADALAERLKSRGDRFAAGGSDGRGLNNLFIHPSAMCGGLVGVSRTEHAWTWSGDPERARRASLRTK